MEHGFFAFGAGVDIKFRDYFRVIIQTKHLWLRTTNKMYQCLLVNNGACPTVIILGTLLLEQRPNSHPGGSSADSQISGSGFFFKYLFQFSTPRHTVSIASAKDVHTKSSSRLIHDNLE